MNEKSRRRNKRLRTAGTGSSSLAVEALYRFPVLAPVVLLVLIYYAERELPNYAQQGIAKAFDCAMDFAVPAALSVEIHLAVHRRRVRRPAGRRAALRSGGS
ncbi:hypothetical protein [Candidatus Palauibacter sp.]|uniref:hypothetical protein n=1 Tax=Candidatus Palauibacter sp. TaxID=3101350 RepID=UPI003B0154ED